MSSLNSVTYNVQTLGQFPGNCAWKHKEERGWARLVTQSGSLFILFAGQIGDVALQIRDVSINQQSTVTC